MAHSLRPATAADREWLWLTKTRCLRGYVEQTYGAWDEDIQRARFDATFEAEEIQVISLAGRDAGFIAAKHGPAEVQLFNLMIAPEFQNRGLGTAVLRELLAGARARHTPVRLQVMKVNPARGLYERLGFTVTEETPTHFRMRWRPA
jgi:ribosomal protein S18 acetylase RimI-like enzyme